MRIRSIKPEFWRSADISRHTIEDRLLFIGLWSYVDDNGVGIDKLSAITADLFADDLEQDASETFARVSRGLLNLSEGGRIIRYDVAGAPFLCIVNWPKHQRIDKPGKPRYPTPDQGIVRDQIVVRESVARVSRLEQGNRGTEEQGNRGTEITLISTADAAPVIDRFPEFWKVWPRSEGKVTAVKAFEKAIRKTDPDTIIAAATAYAESPYRPERQFVPHGASWLNAERWNDPAPEPPESARGPQTSAQRNLTTVEYFAQKEANERRGLES